jgi:hypothetical protein
MIKHWSKRVENWPKINQKVQIVKKQLTLVKNVLKGIDLDKKLFKTVENWYKNRSRVIGNDQKWL